MVPWRGPPWAVWCDPPNLLGSEENTTGPIIHIIKHRRKFTDKQKLVGKSTIQIGGHFLKGNILVLPYLKLTANAPENRPFFPPKGSRIVFQPSIFRCKLAVRFRGWKISVLISSMILCSFLNYFMLFPSQNPMSSKEGGGLEIEVRKLPDNDTKVIPGGMGPNQWMKHENQDSKHCSELRNLVIYAKKCQKHEIYLWILMYFSLKRDVYVLHWHWSRQMVIYLPLPSHSLTK